jgi:predicted RNA-binding Zn ribbon-like protein
MSTYGGEVTSEQVPPAAAAIVTLLNSRPHTIHAEALDTPADAAAVLRGLGEPDIDVSDRQLRDLRDLRSNLMAVLSAAHAGDDTGPHWANFTARISGVTFQYAFAPPGVADLRQASGDPLTGRVTRLVAELIESDRWTRMRLCANDECRSVFYDTSRSRTQRWHSYEICGNKHNVAAYRNRTPADR